MFIACFIIGYCVMILEFKVKVATEMCNTNKLELQLGCCKVSSDEIEMIKTALLILLYNYTYSMS